MYAVIQTGGKQYRVAPGDVIEVEKLPGAVGAEVELAHVLAFSPEPGRLLSGAELEGIRVRATIAAQCRGRKIKVFKFKRKKQYKRTIGHRQWLTRLQVTEILTPEAQAAPAQASAEEDQHGA